MEGETTNNNHTRRRRKVKRGKTCGNSDLETRIEKGPELGHNKECGENKKRKFTEKAGNRYPEGGKDH